jgi:site-specific DNA-methyltransferase (adenine-specific)
MVNLEEIKKSGIIEENSIILGDCLEAMKFIKDNSIDLILCDLPYGYTANKWDIIIPFEQLWHEYKRIMKKDTAILLFASGMFTHYLAISNPKMYKYDLIWSKSKCGSPLTAKYKPLTKHESILVFGKGRTKYNPQMVSGEPYKRNWTENKKNNMNFGIKGVETNNTGTRHPSSILNFQQKWRRQDQMHPTQKPVELCEWLISSYSNEGDLVLDNCIGSGTTAIACINTNRNYIGIEKDEKYYKVCVERIENIVK